MSRQKRVSLIGPSGAGKSTSAHLFRSLIPGSVILSVAQPLRDVEEFIYGQLGRLPPSITGVQDGALLQQAREILLSRDPQLLTRKFRSAFDQAYHAPMIINDDCRAGVYDLLKDLGFFFIWVEGNHAGGRSDHSEARISDNPHDRIIAKEQCDRILLNDQGIAELATAVSSLIATLE